MSPSTRPHRMLTDNPLQVSFMARLPLSVRNVFREILALEAVMRVIEGKLERESAVELVRQVLARYRAESIEQHVIEVAMSSIAGEVCAPLPMKAVRGPWEQHAADTVGLAWLSWLQGVSARRTIESLRSRQKKRRSAGRRGAIHLYTLNFWSEAVLELEAGERQAAQRLYKRALELGAQFGTESHPLISWTYAATFFPT